MLSLRGKIIIINKSVQVEMYKSYFNKDEISYYFYLDLATRFTNIISESKDGPSLYSNVVKVRDYLLAKKTNSSEIFKRALIVNQLYELNTILDNYDESTDHDIFKEKDKEDS